MVVCLQDIDKGMRNRVLLVYPPFTKPALLDYAPIGICHLAAYARQRFPDLNIKLIDFTMGGFTAQNWEQELESFKPDLLGISVITMNYPGGRLLAQLTRTISPNTLVVMGGVHAVVCPDDCLRYCDVVVRGDGEEVLCELIEEWPLGKIQGLMYHGEDRHIKRTKDRPMTLNLDDCPFPAYDLLDPTRYQEFPAWHIISSRGCSYNCSFCNNHALWKQRIRFRSSKNVVDEIEQLHTTYSINHIQFQDDMVNVPLQRAFEICNELIDRGLNKEMTFMASLRLNRQLISQELFYKLKEANFKFLGFGVESGSQKVLGIMHKSLTVREVRDAVKMARKAKIKRLMGFIMIGNWGETIWDVLKTWWLVLTTNMETAFSVCTPFPGTEFYHRMKSAGYITSNPSWENFNITSVTVRTDKMRKPTIYAVYVISIAMQLVFATFRGGIPRRSLRKLWVHGLDIIRHRKVTNGAILSR